MRLGLANFSLATFSIATLLALLAVPPTLAQQSAMTFFVTSVGLGKGGDLGGLAGADAHCQALAAAVGAGDKTWRAYLSTQGANAVNARDRIGKGPWVNAKGVTIAKDVTELHGGNNLSIETALSEKGEKIGGRGDKPNQHDILTGSRADGTAFPPDLMFPKAPENTDLTCKNWTSSTEGAARLGHHDRRGRTPDPAGMSWNSAHPSMGCSQAELTSTGGGGLFYCFAAN
jgi:hypothetical protein